MKKLLSIVLAIAMIASTFMLAVSAVDFGKVESDYGIYRTRFGL